MNQFSFIIRKDLNSGEFGLQMANMVRSSASHSLVELPTFISQPVRLVSLSQKENLSSSCQEEGITLSQALAAYTWSPPSQGKVPKWTIILLTISFLSTCLLLMGMMLSLTTEYQDEASRNLMNRSYKNLLLCNLSVEQN